MKLMQKTACDISYAYDAKGRLEWIREPLIQIINYVQRLNCMRFLNYIKYCSYIFLGMMAISSCCHHSEYLFPNCITVSGVRSNDTVMVDVDEFDSYRRDSGLTMDSRYVIYQLVKSKVFS